MCYPDFEQPFEVQCDASDSGIASILSQTGGIIFKYFKYYLEGHKFTIYSDHQPLKWLLNRTL